MAIERKNRIKDARPWLAFIGGLLMFVGTIILYIMLSYRKKALYQVWQYFATLSLLIPIAAFIAFVRSVPQLYAITAMLLYILFPQFTQYAHLKIVQGGDYEMVVVGAICILIGMVLCLVPFIAKPTPTMLSLVPLSICALLWIISGIIDIVRAKNSHHAASVFMLTILFMFATLRRSFSLNFVVLVISIIILASRMETIVILIKASEETRAAGFILEMIAAFICVLWNAFNFFTSYSAAQDDNLGSKDGWQRLEEGLN